jgi:UPF0755 protein
MAKKLVGLMVFLGLLVFVGRLVFLGWIGSPAVGTTKRFTLTQTADVDTIANKLKDEGIIESPFWYRTYALFDSAARHPKAGTYLIQPGQRFSQIAAVLATGPERDEVRVQVIEGWSIADIRRMLKEEQGIPEEEITRVLGQKGDGSSFDPSLREKFSFLKTLAATRSLEGYLFPDTYRVWHAQLPTSLIVKQLEEFQQRIATEKITSASTPLKTLDEVVTLASIVEKEVSKSEDRNMVAGIFLRRLRQGIPLQSDATVNYVTKSGRARATGEDLNVDSAYNTYKNKGLPPGPISNPSEGSIKAVLEPTPSTYLYFLTDEQGKIYYARTLEEHVANRRKAGY